MDLAIKRVELQGRANELAIQEANLAEQKSNLTASLAALEQRATELNRLKHQTLGAIAAIDELLREQKQTSE